MKFKMKDVSLNYESIGSGQPLLILHGWAGHLATMKAALEPIFSATAFRRIYVDLPGMGDSRASKAFASSDALLTILLSFSEEVIGMPFLLVGYSYGGYLARAMAAKGANVSGLLLITPMVVPDDAQRNLPTADWFYKTDTCLQAQKRYNANQKGADELFLAKLREHYALSWDTKKVPSFEQPSLILLGQQDGTVGFSDQLKMISDYPRATWGLLDMAGHNLQMEQPELFEAFIKNWLERLNLKLEKIHD